jgi:arsenate reductase
LTTKGIDYRAINYLEEPLSADVLKELLRSAGLRPQDALRKNEAAYQEHVAGKDLSDDALIVVMAHHPALIQRPIVTLGDKAVLARPLERLSNLGIDVGLDR